MRVTEHILGTRFKNKQTGHVWILRFTDEGLVFVNVSVGGTAEYLDDDLFERMG